MTFMSDRTAHRVFRVAARKSLRAAVTEGAGLWGACQNRRLALDHVQLLGPRAAHAGNGLQKCARIGMLRVAKQLAHRCLFDHLSAIHHHDAIRDARDHAQIMGDPDDRHAQLLAQLFDQLDDLRLNGHVQRRGGFIRDQHFGIASQRNGNHHPLPHAARKLVRVVFQAPSSVGDPDQLQQLNGPRAGLRFVQTHMDAQRLHDLVAHVEHRVQGGHRVLKHEPDLAAAHMAQIIGVDLEKVLPVEQNLPLFDIGRGGGQQPDQRHHGHRFARAGFADNAQKLARLDVETYGIDRVHLAGAGFEHGLQVFDV